jgi:hypothetical protein
MNLFAKTRSPTFRVGTMLSDGMRNASTTNGRMRPKTSTNATSMMTRNSSMPLLRFFFSRSRRSSRRLLIGSP